MIKEMRISKIIMFLLLIFTNSCNIDKNKEYNIFIKINDTTYNIVSGKKLELLINDSIVEQNPKQLYSGNEWFYRNGTYINTTEGTHKGKFYIKNDIICIKLYTERCVYILNNNNNYFMLNKSHSYRQNPAQVKFSKIHY